MAKLWKTHQFHICFFAFGTILLTITNGNLVSECNERCSSSVVSVIRVNCFNFRDCLKSVVWVVFGEGLSGRCFEERIHYLCFRPRFREDGRVERCMCVVLARASAVQKCH